MFSTSPPSAENQRDSAGWKSGGPSMTTTVPDS